MARRAISDERVIIEGPQSIEGPFRIRKNSTPLGAVIQTDRGRRVFAVFAPYTSEQVGICLGCPAKWKNRAEVRTPADAKVGL